MPEELTLALLFDLISKGSATAFLAVMFWLIATERFVPMGRLKACEKERDRLLAEEIADRERAEKELREVKEDRMRLIGDRDRLRTLLERRPR